MIFWDQATDAKNRRHQDRKKSQASVVLWMIVADNHVPCILYNCIVQNKHPTATTKIISRHVNKKHSHSLSLSLSRRSFLSFRVQFLVISFLHILLLPPHFESFIYAQIIAPVKQIIKMPQINCNFINHLPGTNIYRSLFNYFVFLFLFTFTFFLSFPLNLSLLTLSLVLT